MNELQDSLKEKKAKRWFVAIVFVLLGIAAFVSDAIQKGNSNAEIVQQSADAKQDREAANKDRAVLIEQNGQLIAFAQGQPTHEDFQNLVKSMGAVIKKHPVPLATQEPLPAPTV